MTERDELTPEERAAFEALAKEKQPPAYLEDQVVAALQKEDLIKTTTTMNVYLRYAMGIAASVLLFFTGNLVGRQAGGDAEINPLYGYMMILKEDARFQPGDPQAMFEEYAAWMEGLYNKGIKINGQELQPNALNVSQETVEPLKPDADSRVTGYFLIEAKSEAEALAVVKDNPHLKYGGTIELKAFMNR